MIITRIRITKIAVRDEGICFPPDHRLHWDLNQEIRMKNEDAETHSWIINLSWDDSRALQFDLLTPKAEE